MTGDVLRVESDGPVRILTMNQPETRNAFLPELREAMHGIWRRLEGDRDARAVVLTGAGKAFSAGGDFDNFVRNNTDPWHRRSSLRRARELVDDMLRFPLPVVAAVNGAAVGLGCSVAVLCDIVVMAEDAYMADTHVNIGLVAGDGGSVAWPLIMSILRAKEHLLLGNRIGAEEAYRLGLANKVVPAGDLLPAALEYAQRLAAQPTQAVQETKRALNLHLQQAAQTVLPFALAAESESFTTDDITDSIAKFRSRASSTE